MTQREINNKMGKSSYFDKTGMKKGAWSEDEDDKLRAYIQRYGHWNWGLLPKFAGVSRSGKSCRLRWMNYLRPNIKHGNFTQEEDDLVIYLHNKLGNKWSAIASNLPGRSDNEIKNRWNTHLKKRGHATKETGLQLQQESPSPSSSSSGTGTGTGLSSSCQWSDPGFSHMFSPQTFEEELASNFWTQPFLPDNFISQSDSISFQDMTMANEFLWSPLDI